MRSQSYIATPPGATIREQLKDRGMSQKEFAVRMNLSEKHISRLINGEVQLTQEVALSLEMVLGVPAKFWNNLEAIYREKLVKVEAENAMDEDEEIAKQFPYNEMARYGWIQSTKNPKEKVVYLRQYFGVVKLPLLGNEQITRIACRRLAITEKANLALMAWAQEARIQAREVRTAPIDVQRLEEAVPQIRRMTVMTPNEFCPKLEETLKKCGIAVVFLPHLKGSFLQGATFVDGNKIVLGLTVRGKDADKFWFSLFHELAHIVLGHIRNTNGITDQEEKDADNWAATTLIDQDKFTRFKINGDYSEGGVLSFASEQEIAPGIVVGRMQRERLVKYSSALNHLKVQYDIVV